MPIPSEYKEYEQTRTQGNENDSRIGDSSFAQWSAACDELEAAAVEFAEAERKLKEPDNEHKLRLALQAELELIRLGATDNDARVGPNMVIVKICAVLAQTKPKAT